MSKVRVRVLRNLEDMREGDEATVELNDRVAGMVNGGYWAYVDQPVKADGQVRARRGKAVDDGADTPEPE